MRDAAQQLVARGWAVLPLHWPERGQCSCGGRCGGHAAKHPFGPLVPRGVAQAVHDTRHWPSALSPFNVGVALGPVSGVVALDVDPRAGGIAALGALERQLGALPRTLRVETGRGDGGHHLYFRDPGVALRSAIGPGLDLKGAGGYVVGPGSRHIAGGLYRVVDEWEVAELPSAWLEFATSRSIKQEAGGGLIQSPQEKPHPAPCLTATVPTKNLMIRSARILQKVESATPGNRNACLFWAACRFAEMVAEGVMPRGMAEAVLEAAASANGLVRDDGVGAVRATIASGLKRA